MFWVFIMTVPMLLECMYLLFRTTKYDIDDLDGYIQDSWVVIFVSFVGLFSGIFAFGLNPYALNIPALWFVFISYTITMLLAWIANKKFKNELSESIAKLNYTDEHKSMYCGRLDCVGECTETARLKNDVDRLQEKLNREESFRKCRKEWTKEQREKEMEEMREKAMQDVLAEEEAIDNLIDERNAQEEIESLINELDEVEETDRELEENIVDAFFESDETKDSDESEAEAEDNEPIESVKEPIEPEAIEIVEDIREVKEEDNTELNAEAEATEEETIILADEEKQEDLEEAEL